VGKSVSGKEVELSSPFSVFAWRKSVSVNKISSMFGKLSTSIHETLKIDDLSEPELWKTAT